jgi:hypothetical protein
MLFSFACKSKQAEFKQNLFPVLVGPSSKTCPMIIDYPKVRQILFGLFQV